MQRTVPDSLLLREVLPSVGRTADHRQQSVGRTADHWQQSVGRTAEHQQAGRTQGPDRALLLQWVGRTAVGMAAGKLEYRGRLQHRVDLSWFGKEGLFAMAGGHPQRQL